MKELNRNYNCSINELFSSDYGVPQNRKRVIIIGRCTERFKHYTQRTRNYYKIDKRQDTC